MKNCRIKYMPAYPKCRLLHGVRMTQAEFNIKIRAEWYEKQVANGLIHQQLQLV